MIRKALATVIDAAVSFAPADLVALDLWEGDLPDLAGVRAMQVEPRRWWLVDPGTALAGIDAGIGARGALTAFGGGFVRARITGAGWRTLLSVSGLFDTDESALPVGNVTSTVIHHVPVRVLVLAADTCEVFFAASYAATLEQLWRGAISGG
jgi:heterotetrameric sarcosine oxidase gamma subunit